VITAAINSMGIVLQVGAMTDSLSKEELEALCSQLRSRDTPTLKQAFIFKGKVCLALNYAVPIGETIEILEQYGIVGKIVSGEQP